MSDTVHASAPWRLPVLLPVLAAAALILAGVAMAFYEAHLYRVQQVKDVTEQASILAANETAALAFDDRKTAQEYVDAMRVNPELDAVGVYGARHALVASFTRSGPLPPTPNTKDQRSGLSTFEVSVPVIQGGVVVGSVYLRAKVEPREQELLRYARIVLLVIMGLLVVAVFMVSQRALTRANTQLEHRARDLSALNERLQTEMDEHHKTEEALRQSQKMEAIGQLSGGIAHDFNNLLMIVQGNLQILRRRLGKGEMADHDRYLDSSEEGLRRAANLTQRLLAFARQQPLAPKRVNLSGLVAGMTDLIEHSIGERIDLTRKLDAQWTTVCDVNQMENVILNLAINARDAMADGGRLHIETRDRTVDTPPPDIEGFTSGDYVELALRDNGAGMSDETRRRAIDPFFTTKPIGKGTGLGLSMTFGYVRQSGGYLVLESAEGRGTTVRILMPRAAQDSAMEAPDARTG